MRREGTKRVGGFDVVVGEDVGGGRLVGRKF